LSQEFPLVFRACARACSTLLPNIVVVIYALVVTSTGVYDICTRDHVTLQLYLVYGYQQTQHDTTTTTTNTTK